VSLKDETSKIPLQGGVERGPIYDHPLLGLVLGLAQGQGRADHGAGQLLAPLGITGLDTHRVVYRDAAVRPGQPLGHPILVDGLAIEQEL